MKKFDPNVYQDISKLISFQPGSGINPTHVTPFVMFRVSERGVSIRWLEYSPTYPPTAEQIHTYKPASKYQKPDRFLKLKRVADTDTGPLSLIYQTVADRDGSTLAVAPASSLHRIPGLSDFAGCLWTTLP